jgi:mono/diheme cytochrome c family protein
MVRKNMHSNVCVCAGIALVLIASVPRVHAEDAVAQGETIYESYCASCHGEGLQNNSGGVTFDLRRLKSDDYPRFMDSVMHGKDKMPPWKGVLTETQIDQIWAYVRASVLP